MDHAAETPQAHRSADADTTDLAEDDPFRLPTREEQIEAHRLYRQTVDEVYAAWNRENGTKADASTAVEPTLEVGDQEHLDTALPARTTDEPSATEEALRKRVSELEADRTSRDRQLAAQDAKLAEQVKTIVEQGERIDRLEAYAGQLTTAVRELRQQDEPRPSAEIAHRAGGGQADRAERAEPQRERRLPTDAVNNVISLVAGGTITELAYHVRELSPEYAGIGASGLAIGAGIVAVLRERRKAKDNADHRPEG